MQWFRLYNDIVDNHKIRMLAFEDRWHFVALCCLKSDGLLDEPDSDLRTRRIAVKLGVQVRELDEISRRLREVELIDNAMNPLAWDELQYKSDKSTDRVKAFRERQKKQGGNKVKQPCNVSETAQETEQNRTEQKKPRERGSRHAGCPEGVDEQTYSDFLKQRKKPFTVTAQQGFAREVAKAGWDLTEAYAYAAMRGWEGFNSDWVDKRTGATGQARQAHPELKALHDKLKAREITPAQFDQQRDKILSRRAA